VVSQLDTDLSDMLDPASPAPSSPVLAGSVPLVAHEEINGPWSAAGSRARTPTRTPTMRGATPSTTSAATDGDETGRPEAKKARNAGKRPGTAKRHQPLPPSSPGGVFLGERFPSLTIATPRLHVRPLTRTDAPRVTEIFSDRLTQRWLPFAAEFGAIDGRAWCGEMAQERRSMGQGDHYGVVRREDDRLIGCLWTKRTDWMARSTEVSFALSPDARGFGVAAEAIDGLAIELIMRYDFGRIELRVAPGNTASRRVAEKAGFHYEGLLRNAGYVHSGRVDLEMWSLVAADLR
jgi:ribosomal-protein-alanine N-acetyltransferase